MPSEYLKIPGAGYCNFADIYARMVQEAPDEAHLVEIGTFLGRSACLMAELIRESGKPLLFDTVDLFDDSHLPEWAKKDIAGKTKLQVCRQYLVQAGVDHLVNIVPLPSVKAAELFQDKSVWFAWIDADHSREAVAADVAAWYPKIKPGGYIGGHDYNNDSQSPDVQAAVDAFFGREAKPGSLACGEASWLVRVTQ